MTCDKKQFASYREAKEVINYIHRKSSKNRIPIRPYLCEFCQTFHITSQVKDKKKKKDRKKTRTKGDGYLESWQKHKKF